MKNLILTVFFISSVICASAQKVYFIYLQSDNNASFYVKMSDKIYSSATSGYLILSNLIDSTYNFSIGFPSSQSESKFIVQLGARDKGFLIKNFESGPGLFDLQNLTITNAIKDDAPKNISYIRRTDDFSSLLSKAARDTSLLYAVVRVKEEEVAIQNEQPKSEEIKPKLEETSLAQDTTAIKPLQTGIAGESKKQDSGIVAETSSETNKTGDVVTTSSEENVTKDSLAIKDNVLNKTVNESPAQVQTGAVTNTVPDTVVKMQETAVGTVNGTQEAVFKRSQVKKHSESSTSEGFGLIYYDISDDGQDTIRLLIPNPPIVFKQPEQDSLAVQKDFIHVDELKKDTIQQAPIVVAVKKNALVKSQCKTTASNSDFFKLRKNMASENTDDGMIAEAKKLFKSKCFTTEQIKNLSSLFLTSAGKYQFFDAAFLHVSDQENFSSLQAEIKDDYYLKRFRALLGD